MKNFAPYKRDLIKKFNYIGFLLFSFLMAGCGSSNDQSFMEIPSGITKGPFSDLKAVNSAGPYSGVIIPCIAATTDQETCTLSKLPLIGQEKEQPTVDDIMDRVVVSHDWMGQRFREILEKLPPDILTLLKAVTAVVIDNDVRPSYYWITGAIYLDPGHLWLTNEEKATINKKEDFRIGFGLELPLVPLARYVKKNAGGTQYEKAYEIISLDSSLERNLHDIFYLIAHILYHELAHANDFFPPGQISQLDSSFLIKNAMDNLQEKRISSHLDKNFQLTSKELKDLARVLYHGATASPTQKNYTPVLVGSFFEPDAANDNYNYSNEFEDVAMLFEEVMMKYHFNIERDVAFAGKNHNQDPTCETALVAWGTRKRIGEPQVTKRAKFVTDGILPKTIPSDFFLNLETPILLQTGKSWCDLDQVGLSPPIERGEPLAKPDLLGNDQLKHDSFPGVL
ncbi:MAG TPA: hypothetical protein VGB26_07800 [Nitrospiria bacterium]